MEIKEIIDKENLIGVVSNYQSNINMSGRVIDLNIRNIEKALVMVGLNESFIEKELNTLSLSELWKVELATKLDKEYIIVGNLSKNLIYKDIDYMKKLLIKLSSNYNKKIVVIDEDINVFLNFINNIYVMKNKKIVYNTNNFFDSKLYEFTKMPKIIEFIKYVNKDKKLLDENTEVYELIKDIYRRVS